MESPYFTHPSPPKEQDQAPVRSGPCTIQQPAHSSTTPRLWLFNPRKTTGPQPSTPTPRPSEQAPQLTSDTPLGLGGARTLQRLLHTGVAQDAHASLPSGTQLTWLMRMAVLKGTGATRAGLEPLLPPAALELTGTHTDFFTRNPACTFSLFAFLSNISLPVDILGKGKKKKHLNQPHCFHKTELQNDFGTWL